MGQYPTAGKGGVSYQMRVIIDTGSLRSSQISLVSQLLRDSRHIAKKAYQFFFPKSLIIAILPRGRRAQA